MKLEDRELGAVAAQMEQIRMQERAMHRESTEVMRAMIKEGNYTG